MSTQLRRKINLFGLTMIAVGSSIGAGIFVTPYVVAAALPHAGWILLVWALGGLIALTGALTFAELGGMFPRAGGVYVFLKESFGELPAFLYGWVTLLVVNTGSLAALGLAFADYFTFFVPLALAGKLLLAALVIAGLTLINMRGVGVSNSLVSILTVLKLLAIGGIVLVAFLFYDPAQVRPVFDLGSGAPPDLMGKLLIALVGVLWSFGGWHHASYLAGEADRPQWTVPRAMLLGAVIVTVTYVLVNLAYLLLLPVEEIANSNRVAGDAIATVVDGGGRWVAGSIGISVFGTIAIYTMSAPRVYFAMARDGLFFPQLARLHSRYRTPVNAMVIQALWALILLFFWGALENLITYVTFIDIAFMALAAMGLFVLRRRAPHLPRPYRTWGYPLVPLVFIGISTAFVISTLIQKPVQALAGLVVLGVGILVWYRFSGVPMEEED